MDHRLLSSDSQFCCMQLKFPLSLARNTLLSLVDIPSSALISGGEAMVYFLSAEVLKPQSLAYWCGN